MNPSPEKIRKAMDLLEKHTPEKHCVNMEYLDCSHDPECGTVACFAGFYALAKMIEIREVKWICPAGERAYLKIPYKYHMSKDDYCSFGSGLNLLGADIGFEWDELCAWAMRNTALWGNNYGADMFSSGRAYDHSTIRSELKISEIIGHWRGVADRIEEKNNEAP